jgi:hypothetical protein
MSNEPKHNEPTGADIVVKTLEQQGVKWIFGIPGAKIDKVFDTLVDSSIQTVVCRHKQNATFIAGGIGRMTERPVWPIVAPRIFRKLATKSCEISSRRKHGH